MTLFVVSSIKQQVYRIHSEIVRKGNLFRYETGTYVVLLEYDVHFVTPTSDESKINQKEVLRVRTWAEQFQELVDESARLNRDVALTVKEINQIRGG